MYQLQTLVPQQARVYESLPCEDYRAHQEHHLLELMEFALVLHEEMQIQQVLGKAQAPFVDLQRQKLGRPSLANEKGNHPYEVPFE